MKSSQEKNSQTQVEQVRRNVLINSALAGLTSTNPEHKQWYLEQILKTLCNEEEVKDLKSRDKWEDGIEP